jgi:hypothetical protein
MLNEISIEILTMDEDECPSASLSNQSKSFGQTTPQVTSEFRLGRNYGSAVQSAVIEFQPIHDELQAVKF